MNFAEVLDASHLKQSLVCINQYLDFGELAYYAIPIWVAQYGYHENSLKAEHPELKHVAWQYADSFDGMPQDVSEWYGF